jgi:hypothetical protein
MLLGDTYNKSKVHKISCGDVVKLGSVSLLITEVCRKNSEPETLPAHVQQWLYQAFAKASDVDSSTIGEQMSGVGRSEGVGAEGPSATMHLDPNQQQQQQQAGGAGGEGAEREPLIMDRMTTMRVGQTGILTSDPVVEPKTPSNAQQEEGKSSFDELDGGDDPAEDGPEPEERYCYVCTGDEDTPEDPIVAPCKCKGGTKYVARASCCP